jgi:hypothetical protein
MKSVLILLVLFATAATSGFGVQSDDLSGRVGFVNVTTAQVVKAGEPVDRFAPNVLLRFTRNGTSLRFLAMTGKDGTAFLPIEAGEYCVDAFGLDGHRAKLLAQTHQCFTAIAGKAVEFSLTLAADARYGGTVPPVGVE